MARNEENAIHLGALVASRSWGWIRWLDSTVDTEKSADGEISWAMKIDVMRCAPYSRSHGFDRTELYLDVQTYKSIVRTCNPLLGCVCTVCKTTVTPKFVQLDVNG